ncbi:glutamine---fructose-6-phosphate transaminase (isomerizing) [Methylomarinovum caldicuralii]|uniref:Glutamine--fructose-6-phosphate aminotransferase [isomerizing] n=1 Tax=Methylomarinovum caldicuralii TaxID=438856 RepID=A0AAU9CTH5_9GAMM|nr:glutamine--fructose-6-phosphate transaminase (isomerizing) [Methylomarinovum caldicuralii]BCX81202.1 glutamine---fructose-6-phosphate transaminase (isomerizing) [Methylomarinovum caldicuralii]
MCGIVGAIAQRNVVPILIEGLRRLEYRGYDSAGVAVIQDGEIRRRRKQGKVAELAAAIEADPIEGRIGIAHTRWATHGVPSERNAHPHVCRNTVALVHNGIIENHETLREEQIAAGYEFTSETDTEVVVHAVYDQLQRTGSLLEAVQATVAKLEGAYAIGVISVTEPDVLVACRKGSPLVIGLGIGEYFIASDIAALLPVTRRFIFLEDGDIAELTPEGVRIFDEAGNPVERPVKDSEVQLDAVERGEYRHYMQKEIFEQPRAIAETLEGRFNGLKLIEEAFGNDAPAVFDRVKAVQILACGTSYHAGLVARYWMESLAGIPCNVEVASEYRYRDPVLLPDTLVVTISQSGETADTLAALEEAKRRGALHSLAICNVQESSLVRESDLVLLTRAGPEIGVASTKAFTTQLVALMMLTLALGRRHRLDRVTEKRIASQLFALPARVEDVLELDDRIRALSERFADKQHALFLGRGSHYPIAMEGALKLKEISYIHAEAYPAGELKHGPLALVDADMPVIAVAPNNSLLEKLKSNLQEVKARGGELYVFADETLDVQPDDHTHVLTVTPTENELSPVIFTVPLQLLAYHVAVIRGTDVDKPRNLAKSVTVE